MRFDQSSFPPEGSSSSAAATATGGGGGGDDSPPRDGGFASVDERNEESSTTGSIIAYNTVETYKSVNKNDALDGYFLPKMLELCGVLPGTEEEDREGLTALTTFLCLTRPDVKNHSVVYWFAFPALAAAPGRSIRYAPPPLPPPSDSEAESGDDEAKRRQRRRRRRPQEPLIEAWGVDGVRSLSVAYRRLRLDSLRRGSAGRAGGGGGAPAHFLIVRRGNEGEAGEEATTSTECRTLSAKSFRSLSDEDRRRRRVAFGFLDPTTAAAAATAGEGSGGDKSGGGKGGGSERGSDDGGDDDAPPPPPSPVGWTLRNLIAYLSLRLDLGGTDVDVVSYRPSVLRRISSTHDDGDGKNGKNRGETKKGGNGADEAAADGGDDRSLLLRIRVPDRDDYVWPPSPSDARDDDNDEANDNDATATERILRQYRSTGWELNARSKPGPRYVDLSSLLSPSRLAVQAADLNLKLMKWRTIPNLDVEGLKRMKVLILGAGTLGCSVARALLGWGVRNFTFVDNGTVSYSNPVRQSLFTLEDCRGGPNGKGKPKARAAADALSTIAADVEAESHEITIPMPGHPFGEAEEAAVRRDVETLDRLTGESDVVFLLTDTRESRWLPTVTAAAHDRLLINAALGLDSYLVMRHGGGIVSDRNEDDDDDDDAEDRETDASPRLGCYFCNDVVAPENSTRNRTLDQQCTVARPGLAPIAGSVAAELCASVFHHPLRHRAPPPPPPPPPSANNGAGRSYAPAASSTDARGYGPLGSLPHQIRGSIATHSVMTPAVPAFSKCSGCSGPVVDAYRKDKFELVKEVCDSTDGRYLDELSGLSEFREEAARKAADCEDWDDDDDD